LKRRRAQFRKSSSIAWPLDSICRQASISAICVFRRLDLRRGRLQSRSNLVREHDPAKLIDSVNPAGVSSWKRSALPRRDDVDLAQTPFRPLAARKARRASCGGVHGGARGAASPTVASRPSRRYEDSFRQQDDRTGFLAFSGASSRARVPTTAPTSFEANSRFEPVLRPISPACA